MIYYFLLDVGYFHEMTRLVFAVLFALNFFLLPGEGKSFGVQGETESGAWVGAWAAMTMDFNKGYL
jgi:hypothetical protein